MRFEPERLSLECLHCGFRTAGWTIGTEERFRHGRAAAVVPIARDSLPLDRTQTRRSPRAA
jgi:hypothetical protein